MIKFQRDYFKEIMITEIKPGFNLVESGLDLDETDNSKGEIKTIMLGHFVLLTNQHSHQTVGTKTHYIMFLEPEEFKTHTAVNETHY